MKTASQVAVYAAAMSQNVRVPSAWRRVHARPGDTSDVDVFGSSPSGQSPIERGSRRMTVAASASAPNTPMPNTT